MNYFAFFYFIFWTFFAHSLSVLVPNEAYLSLVERISGKRVEVKAILPGGGDLHHFDLTFEEISKLKDSELWIQIDQPFEHKLKNVVTAQSLQLNTEKERDSHFWLSFTHLHKHASLITEKLIELDPKNKETYTQNVAILLEQLETALLKAKKKQKQTQLLAVGTSHDALRFFCKDVGIEQIALDDHGSELSIKQLQEAMNRMRDRKVKQMIYIHPHGKKPAEKIASTLNLKLIHFNPNSTDVLKNLTRLADELYGSSS